MLRKYRVFFQTRIDDKERLEAFLKPPDTLVLYLSATVISTATVNIDIFTNV